MISAIEIKSTLNEFNDSAGQQADADTFVNRFAAETKAIPIVGAVRNWAGEP